MKLFSAAMPYLLLVTFYSGQLNNFGIEKINAINESPYQGVAVSLADAYDSYKHSEQEFEPAVKRIKIHAKKHIWPWVFFNRFIAYGEEGKRASPLAKAKYFENIKGIDLYNEAGALQDFYDLWRFSLRISKETGSPGIVVDPEAYNNKPYGYSVAYVAKKAGRSSEEVKNRLREIGGTLVDIADKEYAQAVLWFLFTDLPGRPLNRLDPTGERDLRTVTFIIKGMLERAKETGSRLKIISGGEYTLGYCHPSLNDLKQKIEERNQKYAWFVSQYPNLSLGGTLAPWDDSSKKKPGYFSNERCNNELKNLEDFKPLVTLLARSYDYVWLYAAWAVGFNPYNTDIAAPYNKSFREAVYGQR